MKISENVKKVLVVLTTVVAAGLLIYYAGPACIRALLYLFSLFSPFVFGYIIARMINPIADKLQAKLKIARGISVVFVIIVTVVIIFGLIGLLGYKLFDEIRDFINDWPVIMASLRANWMEVSDNWSKMYIDMPDFVKTVIDKAWADIYKQGAKLTSEIPVFDAAQVIAKSLPAGLIWTVMFILSLFFMVSQKKTVTGFLYKTFGERAVIKVNEIKNQCKTYLGGYVKAQLILMVIIFVTILIILSLANAPFAVLVAAITALLDALPFLGSGIVLWPMAIVYFIDDQITLCIVYIVTYFVTMILRRLIEPKLVSDKIGLNPIITLVAMYIGYKFWGIIGLITGPLLLMLIISLYQVGLFKRPMEILKQLLHFVIKQIKLFGAYLNEITK